MWIHLTDKIGIEKWLPVDELTVTGCQTMGGGRQIFGNFNGIMNSLRLLLKYFLSDKTQREKKKSYWLHVETKNGSENKSNIFHRRIPLKSNDLHILSLFFIELLLFSLPLFFYTSTEKKNMKSKHDL